MQIAHPWVRHGARLLAAVPALAALALPARAADPAPARAAAAAADPHAAVPATIYRPAIGYRTEAPAQVTPDQAWQDSNAIVAGYNSMALTMKGMGGHAMPPADHAGRQGHRMPAQPPAAAPAQPHHHDHKESP